MKNPHGHLQERIGALSGAIFLFGLAFLFQFHWIWPGILPLILLTAMPPALLESGWRFGLWILVQTAIWLLGLPLLIVNNLIWPGVLVLAGVSALIVAIAPPDRLQAEGAARRQEREDAIRTFGSRKAKIKSKRGLPLTDEDEADEEPGSLASMVASGDNHQRAGQGKE